MRIVFMGSPDFALPALRALANKYHVVGVVTQPGKPAGRGRELTQPPVKHLADALGIPTMQPARLKDPEVLNQLRGWSPTIIVVVAYGKILGSNILELPPLGCINIHASLLPRWRGAAPIQAALLHGDPQTGITIMKMDEGIDTGPILSQRALIIEKDDNLETLSNKLAQMGADLIIETLPAYANGNIIPIPQDDSLATYAPMLTKQDGGLEFSQASAVLENKIRALNPWPGTYFLWQNKQVKVLRARHIDIPSPGVGVHLVWEKYPAIGTGKGILVLETIQLPGKKPVQGIDFLRGERNWEKQN